MFTLLKKEDKARRGIMETVHGTFQTPCFMNVGTAAAIKGGVSSVDLKGLKTQVELCNTYHLHLRPGDKIIKEMGGLHKFMNWDKPILTDSGGFQVFSLAQLRKIKEEGVYFASHIDGRRIFMGPEESMQIQSNLGSTIAMAFDECIENPSPHDYVEKSIARTTRWLYRCKDEMERLNSLHDTINKKQMLFGINQGSTFDDLRIRHMEEIAALDLDGYAIGGLAVGESTEEMLLNRLCLLINLAILWALELLQILLKQLHAELICSTALCQAATPAMLQFLPGAALCTFKINATKLTLAPLMWNATALFAKTSHVLISGICLRLKNSSPADLLLCIIYISTIL